jgi:hypothetical protein
MADEAVLVFEGTTAEAEALRTVFPPRDIDAAITRGAEIEGGTAIVEAQIFVPPDELEEAQALIADVKSGAASR